MKVELWAITPGAERLIERAGRVCWKTELSPTEDGKAAFIEALIRRGHLSVIEHPSATFFVSDISRACSHQLVRHRLASYSQESQRYVDTSRFVPVIPETVADNPEAHAIFASTEIACKVGYRALRELGIPKQDARFLLPNATPTSIVATMNFRQWRHFFNMRCDKHAQWEIRAVANEVLRQLYKVAPSVFEDLYRKFLWEVAK
jgi:thymidylate synthase (FAD)